MKRPQCSRILLITVLSCIFALYVEEAMAQDASLCFDFYFLPTKKVKKPKDSTCVVIENGFMYKKAEEIVKLSGLPMNFVVCQTNGAQNAFAALDKYGNRYIKYDDVFMKRLNSDSSALESMIILAHEIGHHIFFHTILSATNDMALNYQQYGVPGTANYDAQKFRQAEEEYYETRRRQELEADRFAGFIMAKKGIQFEQVAGFYKKLDKYYTAKNESTHPSIDKRIDALKEGFVQVDSTLSGKPINLSKLGKEKLDLVFNNVTKMERNKLLQKIVTDAIDVSAKLFVNGQYKLGYGTNGNWFSVLDTVHLNSLKTYLGKDIKRIRLLDDGKDYFEVQQTIFYMVDAPTVVCKYYSGFHIRGGYFYLILFDPAEGLKVAYKSRFSDDQISIEEIKLLYARIFKKEVQKMIDNYVK